jgi:hypothetical protein
MERSIISRIQMRDIFSQNTFHDLCAEEHRRAPVSSQLFLCCSCHPRRRPLSCIAGRTPTRSPLRSLLPFTPLSPLAFLSGRDDWASASAALRQVPRSAQGLRFISSLCFLDLSLLPCSSFPGGDDWASGGAICPVFAQPFAGDERILQINSYFSGDACI